MQCTGLTVTALAISSAIALVSGAVAGSVASESAAAPEATADPYGYAGFYDIPNLGPETARGTGCGGDGSIGDTIPDGYWRGYVRLIEGDLLEFDLVCVYGDDVSPELISRWRQQHPGEPEPWVADGFLVDNNARVRVVPLADSFFVHGTQWIDGAGCPFFQPNVPFDGTLDAWLRIEGGQAQWAVSSCSGPASFPPPPSSGSGFQWPYADYFSVPQLGAEPVRGTGCGGSGGLGDVIPDGLWFGDITAQGQTSLDFNLVCIVYGADAVEALEDWIAENGESSPPWFGDDGFPLDNNDRTRVVPLAPAFETVDAHWVPAAEDRLVCLPPAPGVQSSLPADYFPKPSWLFIVDGQAQWSFTSCPYN